MTEKTYTSNFSPAEVSLMLEDLKLNVEKSARLAADFRSVVGVDNLEAFDPELTGKPVKALAVRFLHGYTVIFCGVVLDDDFEPKAKYAVYDPANKTHNYFEGWASDFDKVLTDFDKAFLDLHQLCKFGGA